MRRILLCAAATFIIMAIGFYSGYRYTVTHQEIRITGDHAATADIFGQVEAYRLGD